MIRKISLTVFVISIALLILMWWIVAPGVDREVEDVIEVLAIIFWIIALISIVSRIICKIWNK